MSAPTARERLAEALWRVEADQSDDPFVPESYDLLPEWAQAVWEERADALMPTVETLVAERVEAWLREDRRSECTHPNCEQHGKSPCEGIDCNGLERDPS